MRRQGGKSLRWEGAERTAGAWGPGAGGQALQALGWGLGVLLLEGLRREKTCSAHLRLEKVAGRGTLILQPLPPSPVFSSRVHLLVPLGLGS